MTAEPISKMVGDWNVRVWKPEGEGPHPVILLLHGWTGDENSMWIFTNRLPKHYYLIAPRGRFTTPLGGYGWYPHRYRGWPPLEDFLPAIHDLLDLLIPENFPGADFTTFRMAGFSQGAALVYTLALLHPERVVALAGLAGFMPEKSEARVQEKPLQGKPAYVAHGSRDSQVPIERARQSVELLERAGAQVTYCEDDVGHKLSAACFRGFREFFEKH